MSINAAVRPSRGLLLGAEDGDRAAFGINSSSPTTERVRVVTLSVVEEPNTANS